jgi:hypothetical protein
LNDKVSISYQVTTEAGPGGVVSARDFIFIFKSDFKGAAFVQGGCSVDYPGPKDSKIVRSGVDVRISKIFLFAKSICKFGSAYTSVVIN